MAKIILDDPVLDANDEFTRLFLLAEYWKNKYVEARQALSQQPPATVEGELTDDEIIALVKNLDLFDVRPNGRIESGYREDADITAYLISFARAIEERALNQRLAVKEGGAVPQSRVSGSRYYSAPKKNTEGDLVHRLRFKWADNGHGYNSDFSKDMCEAADEIERLQALSTHPVSDDQQAKDAAITALLACKEVCSATGAMKEVGMAIDAIAALSTTKQEERKEQWR